MTAMDIERPETEVNDEDVDEMLDTLREQRTAWNEVERTAQAGDQVLIDYVAETEEGRVPAEGNQRLAIIMGASGFDELEEAMAAFPPARKRTSN